MSTRWEVFETGPRHAFLPDLFPSTRYVVCIVQKRRVIRIVEHNQPFAVAAVAKPVVDKLGNICLDVIATWNVQVASERLEVLVETRCAACV